MGNNKKIQKLAAIGAIMGLSQGDIYQIQKERKAPPWYYPIVEMGIVILSMGVGYIIGMNSSPKLVSSETGEVYPFSIMALPVLTAVGAGNQLKKEKTHFIISIILTVVISIICFMIAYDCGRPIEYYSGTILYGVYRRK